MRDSIFYIPDLPEQIEISSRLTLPESESQHAIRVLRMQAGEYVTVVDGRGNAFDCVITTPHHKRCELQVQDVTRDCGKRPFHLHVAFAPTKLNERTEWFLEKATEIGCEEFTPLLTEHSERKELKLERMDKIIIAAMKQSHKAFKPILHPMTSFDTFINSFHSPQAFIAHCHEGAKTPLKSALPNLDTTILIGPEGDFSPTEIERAIAHGCQPCTLGNSRLRTETAALVAVHTLELINQ